MAQDNKIPLGKPGVASFESETWGEFDEVLYSDTPPVATKTFHVKAGAAINWPLYTLVNVATDGTISQAAYAAGASNATGVLAEPIVMASAQEMDVAINVAGHYTQQAINFAASFDSDAKKQQVSPNAPMLLISKRKYTSDAVEQ